MASAERTFTIVLATHNVGKVAEMRALLCHLPVRILSASEIEEAPQVEESAATLAGNAAKKATAFCAQSGLPSLADDTGLSVAALHGRPGVHSARYAGPYCDAAANRSLLLRELQNAADRSASFTTVMAFAEPVGLQFFVGTCRGRILLAERGTGGFGYDALFCPEGHSRSFAELTTSEKNALSHRGKALRSFSDYLRTRLEASHDCTGSARN